MNNDTRLNRFLLSDEFTIIRNYFKKQKLTPQISTQRSLNWSIVNFLWYIISLRYHHSLDRSSQYSRFEPIFHKVYSNFMSFKHFINIAIVLMSNNFDDTMPDNKFNENMKNIINLNQCCIKHSAVFQFACHHWNSSKCLQMIYTGQPNFFRNFNQLHLLSGCFIGNIKFMNIKCG